MDNLIRHFQSASVLFTVNPDRSISIDRFSEYYQRKWVKSHPWLYFSFDRYGDNVYQTIECSCYKPTWVGTSLQGKTVFVSKASKLSRDLLRNSGYKITYSQDKADIIIVPKYIPEKEYMSTTADILVKNPENDKVYFCNIVDSLGYKIPTIEFIKALANEINVDYYMLDYHAPGYKFNIYYVRDIPEYLDILRGTILKGKDYILDSEIPLTPTNIMSVETLDLWSRLAKSQDYDILEKSILNSDAREYPLTLYMFLNNEPNIRYYYSSGLSYLLTGMGIKNRFAYDKVVEPKDVKLLNDWLMYKMGLPSEGGITTETTLDGYSKLFRKRYCVAPIKVENPITFANLQELAKS